MEGTVNESANENRKKTNIESLIAFVTVYVVAIFLLIYNSKQHDQSSMLDQKYFWNIQNPRNFVYIFITNGFLYKILLIFKKSANTLVWCIFTLPLMFMSLLIAVWLFMIFENTTYHEQSLWIPVVLFTVFATGFGMLLYKYRVNINLVTEIIRESLRAVEGVRFLSLIPVLNSLFLLIPMNIYYKAYEHIKYEDYSFSMIWVTVTFLLFLFFMDEFQKFLIAGVTTKCYFTRDKSILGQPIFEILKLLVKFHLGSVCYGAMIKCFRPLFRFLSSVVKTFNLTNNNTIISLTNWLDTNSVSNNAYILVSKDGTPYYESGRKLFILQSRDPINSNKMNNSKSITNLVMKLFLFTVIATVQALILDNDQNFQKWSESNVEVFITLLYIFSMVSIYINYIETITDTTIIAACIDFDTNDGNLKPYFMSKSLEDFVRKLRTENQSQVIISRRLGPPVILEVPQTAAVSTIYNPSQQPSNIVYLSGVSNQVRDELIPVQSYQPSAPQLE